MSKVLKASGDNYLYNGEMIVKEILLSDNDNKDNWQEITPEEKARIEKEEEEKYSELQDITDAIDEAENGLLEYDEYLESMEDDIYV